MFKEQQLQTFLDQLASSASTPGGGSAAAIMGAMGAALVSMVANLTVGKKKYEEVEEEMQGFLEQSEALRERLTGMIQADVDVFDQVMAAYGMARETEEEKARRSQTIQAALKEATDVPLACAQLCADVIELGVPFTDPLADGATVQRANEVAVAAMTKTQVLRLRPATK